MHTTYYDFDDEKLVNLARQAAEIGVDVFALHDGWFGNRHSDKTGLGDWRVNESKYAMKMEQLYLFCLTYPLLNYILLSTKR